LDLAEAGSIVMRYLLVGLLLLGITIEQPLAATHISAQLPNGLTVNAEYRPAAQGKPTVLLIHPLQQTYNFSTVKNLADSLSEEGYGILSPNLSLGINDRKLSLECEAIHTQTIEQDIREIDFWVKWLSQTVNTPIIAIGHSSGALQVLGYSDTSRLRSLILISLVTIGPVGAASIDLEQFEQAIKDREQGNPDQLGRYKFSYCNSFASPRDVYLELASWDQEKVSQELENKTVPVQVIFGDKDFALYQSWLSDINNPNVSIHYISGSNHFFSGIAEFELHDKVLEILRSDE
jgi:pimeloyl-ACP methyl ester carboxylesterase